MALRLTFPLTGTLVVLVAGLAQAASLATPWDGQPLWWLQLLSLALLGWQLQRGAARAHSWSSSTWANPSPLATWRQAAWLGWVYALAWLTGSFWWLFISMHTYGGLAAPLAALAVLALAGALAVYYAVACGLWAYFFSAALAKGGSGAAALGFAALWTGAELARASWLTGFPWGAGAYAHVDGPLAVYAPWIGVQGVGAVAAWLALALPGALAKGLRQSGALHASVSLVLVLTAALHWGALSFSQTAGRESAALLQGNIPQDQKFQPGTGVADSLRWYGENLQSARAALVVAPETALPLLPADLPVGYLAELGAGFAQGPAAGPGRAALIGIPLGSFEKGYTNSVIGLTSKLTEPYQYHKQHLVPFGEFIPPGFRWFTQLMNIPLGDFNRGALAQPSLAWRGQRLAPNICYEDLFGEEIAARFADPAQAPTALVNLSNIAWFGNSLAIDQHLHISRMRALEFERPMLRATNTGATVIINHQGVVTHSQPRHTRGVLLGEFEGRTGLTPYARWASAFGHWPLWVFALLAFMAAAWAIPNASRK